MRVIAIIAIVAISALGWAVASFVRPQPAAIESGAASAPDVHKEAAPPSRTALPTDGSAEETPVRPATDTSTATPQEGANGTVQAESAPGSTLEASADDRALLTLLTAMSDKVDAVMDAVRDHDTASLLHFQHELLGDIERGRELAGQDASNTSRQVLGALNQLEDGLSGDMTKLSGASRALSEASQALARERGVTLAPRPKRVEDLQRFARDAAAKVANFRKSYDQGDPSRLLRLQRELLQVSADGLESLRTSHSPEAEQVKSALQDIQEALPDNPERLRDAEQKLAAAAGIRLTPEPATQPSPTATVERAATSPVRGPSDLVPLVNQLGQSLSQVRQADAAGEADASSRARAALAEAIQAADQATAGASFPEAERLRRALPLLEEVAQGNNRQIDAASSALGTIVGR